MKRQLGLLSVFGVILFMAMTVFAGDVFINGEKWGTFTDFHFDFDNGKVELWGTAGTPPPTTGNTIKGNIKNSTNFNVTVGIPNVTVSLAGPTAKTPVNTGADGSYQFTGLEDGSYTVTPSKANYVFTQVDPDPAPSGGNQTVTVNFTAEPTTTGAFQIAGTVFNTTGTTGLSPATVQLRLGSTLIDSISAENGAYTLDDLLDGLTYRVTPVSGTKTFNPAYSDVTINNGSVSGKNFTEVAAPTIGQWTAAIKGAYLLNQIIYKQDGSMAGFGMGFRQGMRPDAVYCQPGKKTYFLADTSWKGLVFYKRTVTCINFAILGKSQTTSLIKLDANDNGSVVGGPTSGKQVAFSIGTAGKYLVEVDLTGFSDGFSLDIFW